MNSNSHHLPYSKDGKEQLQTWTLEPIGNQALLQTLMANYGNLFNSLQFQTLELISQSLQLFQNRAKDPRGTPEHGTSILRRRPWNLDLSSRIGEALLHINPTCSVEAELGVQNATETVLDWTYWKYRTAQRATLHSKSSANITKDNNTCSILFILWLSRWAQAKCCQNDKSMRVTLQLKVTCYET